MRVSGAMTMRLGRSRSPMRTGVKSGWMRAERVIGAGPSRLLSGESEDRLRPTRAVVTDFCYLLCVRCQTLLLARQRCRIAVEKSGNLGVDQDEMASAPR